MAGYVLWMGAMRLMEPIELPTTAMLYAAVGGIVTELIAFWLLYERQEGNLKVIRFTGFLKAAIGALQSIESVKNVHHVHASKR